MMNDDQVTLHCDGMGHYINNCAEHGIVAHALFTECKCPSGYAEFAV